MGSSLMILEAKLIMVGLGGLEPPTSRLSGVRSNQLSYRPDVSLFFIYLMKEICRQRMRQSFASGIIKDDPMKRAQG